jgi:hypothetical protein
VTDPDPFRPISPIRVTRRPEVPIRIVRTSQAAPVVRLAGVVVHEVGSPAGDPGDLILYFQNGLT